MRKLFVGVPWSSPFFFTDTFDSITDLETPPDTLVRIGRGTGFCPARRHNHICEQALLWDADYILIIGADQTYEPDMLCRLMARIDEGYEALSALVNTRGFVEWQDMKPFQKMAWRFKTGNLDVRRHYTGMEEDGDLLELLQPNSGMQRVDFIGSGVLMFQRDHLLAIKRPWFQETIIDDGYNRRASMDCTFVWRLQTEAHAQVWCDTDIQTKHLHIFPIDDTYSDRFPDWKRGDKTLIPSSHVKSKAPPLPVKTERRIFMVAGLPSGGTSLVAGILHYLGVNMGHLPTPQEHLATGTTRKYLGYECDLLWKRMNAIQGKATYQRMFDTVAAYIRERLASDTEPCGFKNNPVVMLGQQDQVQNLPLSIIHVRRNLADVFDSDIKYRGNDPRRAHMRGQFHLGLSQLIERVPPVLTVDYEQILKDPEAEVCRIAEVCAPDATWQQIEQAIAFVDPVGKGVLV